MSGPETRADMLNETAAMFRLMGDPTRLRILLAMLDGPRAVAALALASGASASLVSHHLRLLRGARIVRAERRGRQVFYAMADSHIHCVLEDMITHAGEPRAARSARRTARKRKAA